MIQLHREDVVLLWMAVGKKHIIGKEGLSYTSLTHAYKILREKQRRSIKVPSHPKYLVLFMALQPLQGEI